MISIIRSIIYTVWSKIRHPSLKLTGIHSVRIGTEIIVRKGGKLSIGKSVSTHKRVTLSAISGNLCIGDNTTFNRNDIIVCHKSILIGNNCAFGPNVVIYDHDHKFSKDGFKRSGYNDTQVVIEDNCWIGANVIILRGSKIGEGSVIGAGSVIKGIVPAHSLVRPSCELNIEPIV